MKTFADTVRQLNIERRKYSTNPSRAGFYYNRRGNLQKTIKTSISIIAEEGHKSLGEGVICYADADPSENETDSELIRLQVWNKEDVGWLWAYINGISYMLAKISPLGAESLQKGFINESGQVILKKEKK